MSELEHIKEIAANLRIRWQPRSWGENVDRAFERDLTCFLQLFTEQRYPVELLEEIKKDDSDSTTFYSRLEAAAMKSNCIQWYWLTQRANSFNTTHPFYGIPVLTGIIKEL